MTQPHLPTPGPLLRGIAGAAFAAGLLLVTNAPGLARKVNGIEAITDALAHNEVDKAVAKGEAAVAADPRNAALRAALGRAYARAGRFESAAAVLADAQALGDASPRTALSLALAESAVGRGHDAIEALDAVHTQLPAADYGLALAMAGDTARGVAVLSEALHSGDANPRLRQNLAYADALDGHWADARAVAGIDLTPEQTDARITQWAAIAAPEAYRARVAQMLGAPVVADPGLPQRLALSSEPASPSAPALAVAPLATEPTSAPALAVAPTTPVVADKATEPTSAPALAVAPTTPVVGAPHFVSGPVIEATAGGSAPTPPAALLPAANLARGSMRSPPAARAALGHDTPTAGPQNTAALPVAGHRGIQLGAFDSQAMAQAARARFAQNPAFAKHPFRITRATVQGHQFWRVVVLGFEPKSAADTCATLRAQGGVCFAFDGGPAPSNPRQAHLATAAHHAGRAPTRASVGAVALAHR